MSEKKCVNSRMDKSEWDFICNFRNDPNSKYNFEGQKRKRITQTELLLLTELRTAKGKTIRYNTDKKQTQSSEEAKQLTELKRKEKVFNEVVELTTQEGKFELHKISEIKSDGHRETIPIIQISDNHVDEVVKIESVMGMNEYNLDIAKKRHDTLYSKIVKLITHHQQHYNINQAVILLQGDAIGGWIHDELSQTNSISPNEAIYEYKNMTLSGFKHIQDNLDVDKITVVCVCGNHTRETKKVQYANFNDTNKEYWMYLDLKKTCEFLGLNKFEFIIPKSEMAIIELFGLRYLVAHGHQFKYAGGVGGIFPSMLKWFGQMAKSLKVEMAFIGHWHQSIFTKRVVVNGSPKGYDAYAIGKGLEFEHPSQNMILLDSQYGMCNFQQIML